MKLISDREQKTFAGFPVQRTAFNLKTTIDKITKNGQRKTQEILMSIHTQSHKKRAM